MALLHANLFTIAFPNIDPVAFSAGPLQVKWYSLAYILGIILGWFYARELARRYYSEITPQILESLISYLIFGIILGGRLGYILFYDPFFYLDNPGEIPKTYKGGMSFHGAVIGITIVCFLFSRNKKISFYKITDLITVSAPIGIFLGRIANFINTELVGKISNAAWAVKFPGAGNIPRHPSQIYEALTEGLLLFVILYAAGVAKNGLKKPGYVSSLFLIWYSIFRILMELFREPDYHIGYIFGLITMGQLLSALTLILGMVIYTSKFIYKR
jgi:phosphatidylglycerol:prolipoprotein diacylglycerol transferase